MIGWRETGKEHDPWPLARMPSARGAHDKSAAAASICVSMISDRSQKMADPAEDLSREKEGCGNACVNACSMLSGTVDVHLMELISDESDAVIMRNV